MQGFAGPVGSGVPNQYPLAINTPLDRAYLRPLQQPLYDTEIFDYTTPPSTLVYFQRPISQTTQLLNQTKYTSETNLNQSAMLDYPREFSILGFTISFDSCIGLKLQANILRRAYYTFTFSGNRPYLQIGLDRIPAGMGLEGAAAIGTGGNTSDSGNNITCFKSGLGHVANYFKFNLGRSALKIKPGEAFNGSISWPVALTATAQSSVGGMSTQNSMFSQTPAGTATDPAGYWIRNSLIGLMWQPL